MVEINVHNPTAGDRLLATAELVNGFCDRLGLADAQGRAIGRAWGFQCGCECCTGATQPYSTTWHRMKPGETYALDVWDGRDLDVCTVRTPCDPPWKGAPPIDGLTGSPRPAPTGSYRVTVAEQVDPPEGCSSDDGVFYRCDHVNSWNGHAPGPIEELCPATLTASAEFMLPPRGATTVTVELQ